MVDPILLANGAVEPIPAGGDGAPADGLAVDTMIVGVAAGDLSGDTGLDRSATAQAHGASVPPLRFVGSGSSPDSAAASGSAPHPRAIATDGSSGIEAAGGAAADSSAAIIGLNGALQSAGPDNGPGVASDATATAATASGIGTGATDGGYAGIASGGQTISYGTSSGGLAINVTYDKSVIKLGAGSASTPSTAQFEAGFAAAVNYFTGTFKNNVTLDINAGWGEETLGGSSTRVSSLGESIYNVFSSTYGAIKTALGNHTGSTNQQQAFSTLPAIDPTTGNWFTSQAEAKALGLTTGVSEDGGVGVNSGDTYFFNQSAPVAGEFDFTGVMEHEISEVLGRESYAGTNAITTNNYTPMDLYRYKAASSRQLTDGDPSYFSINSGTTDLSSAFGDWHNYAGGNDGADLGDWNGGSTADPYGPVPTDTSLPPSAVDTELMNVLGYDLACFVRGTLILTVAGEVPVEGLAIGDAVATLSGAAKPIRWIGRRSYAARFVAGNRAVLPIRIAAGAVADGLPARDLFVSPEHALCIPGSRPGTGLLVPARQLLNGASVVQAEATGQIDYFHIELAAHDVIFAEGMPAETFVDCDNRLMFHNAGEFAALYPGDPPPAWQFCAKRLEEGSAELAAIRAALGARVEALGYRRTADPDLHLIVDGEIVRAQAVEAGICRFAIPAGSGAVWLASRSAVPAEVEAGSPDRRRLGVALQAIVLRKAGLCTEIGHGHASLRDGFHDDEDGHRWTDGMARLPNELLRPFAGEVALEVQLVQSGLRYPLDAAATAPARRASGRRPGPRRARSRNPRAADPSSP